MNTDVQLGKADGFSSSSCDVQLINSDETPSVKCVYSPIIILPVTMRNLCQTADDTGIGRVTGLRVFV